MAVRRVRSVGPAGFTHRSTSRGSITVGGQSRIVGTTVPPRPINIDGAERVARVNRGGTSSTGGGTSGRRKGK